MQLHIPKIGWTIIHHLYPHTKIPRSQTQNHYLRSLPAARRSTSTDPRPNPAYLYYVIVPAFSIGCSADWTCSTTPLKPWNQPFYSVPLPQHVYLFHWWGFCCRFWCKGWAPFIRQWVCRLLPSFRSRSSSSAGDSCGVFHIFRRFLWRRRPIKSIYGKIYLFYSLFFFRNSVFPIVPPMLADDRRLPRTLKMSSLTQWFTKSESRGRTVISFFELVEEGGGEQWSFDMGAWAGQLQEVAVGQGGVDQGLALTFVLLLSTHLINDNSRNHFIYRYFIVINYDPPTYPPDFTYYHSTKTTSLNKYSSTLTNTHIITTHHPTPTSSAAAKRPCRLSR